MHVIQQELIEKFAERGYELTFDAERLVATCIRRTKRARLGYKVEFCYRFKTEARRIEFCEEFLAKLERAEQYKAERKAQRAVARKEAQESVKKGDIFVASWGWEQTNVDAYQVVEKKGATVALREIALETVEGSEQFMSDRVRPVLNAFIGERFTKRITGRGINITDCQYATPAEEGKEFYRSWYA